MKCRPREKSKEADEVELHHLYCVRAFFGEEIEDQMDGTPFASRFFQGVFHGGICVKRRLCGRTEPS
jgi:hypothetical protein